MSRALAAFVLLALAADGPVHAVPIAGEFTATVTGARTVNAELPGAISVGMRVTGEFQFSNTGQVPRSSNSIINENRFVDVAPGSFLRISVAGLTWESKGVAITVRNDSPRLHDDLLSIMFDSSVSLAEPDEVPVQVSFPGVDAGYPNSSFAISLFDSNAPPELVDGIGIPSLAAEIDTSAVNTRNGSLFGNRSYLGDGTSYYLVTFNIDQLTLFEVAAAVTQIDSVVRPSAYCKRTCAADRKRCCRYFPRRRPSSSDCRWNSIWKRQQRFRHSGR